MDDRNPTSDRLRRLASRYEAGVGRGRAEQIAARSIMRAQRRVSFGRRVAVAVSSTAFLLVSLTGVGFAADRAVPGDVLYQLDRALEALGFSSDLVEERLLEAITLADRGDMTLAIETANEALAELGRSGVTATLPTVTRASDVLTAETVDEASTTTTDEPVIETTTVPPADEPTDSTEPVAETAESPVEVAAAPANAVETLRLAAEQLLQSVRTAKTDPDSTGAVATAALVLAETTAGTTAEEAVPDTTSSTSSTTSTSTTSTTSTTLSEEPRPGDREGNGTNSGTTPTTVASDPDDGSGSDDSTGSGEDDPPGPIFLPTP